MSTSRPPASPAGSTPPARRARARPPTTRPPRPPPGSDGPAPYARAPARPAPGRTSARLNAACSTASATVERGIRHAKLHRRQPARTAARARTSSPRPPAPRSPPGSRPFAVFRRAAEPRRHARSPEFGTPAPSASSRSRSRLPSSPRRVHRHREQRRQPGPHMVDHRDCGVPVLTSTCTWHPHAS